jgi:hypothetical protein
MQGSIVAKPNYHQVRKQRELARKARQQEKQQRRVARAGEADESPTVPPADDAPGTGAAPAPDIKSLS